MQHERALEIGGFFELSPALFADQLCGETVGRAAFIPAQAQLLRSGRDALRGLLTAFARDGRRRLVVPAFLCDSVLQAAEGTGASWDIRFVPVTTEFVPEAEVLETVLAHESERTCAIAVPLFGKALPCAVVEVYERAQQLGVRVIDDLSHALFSMDVSGIGTDQYASLRKLAPLPDGGFASSSSNEFQQPPLRDCACGRCSDFSAINLVAMTAKQQWLSTGDGKKSDFREVGRLAELTIDRCRSVVPMSMVAKAMVTQMDPVRIAEQRRENYQVLYERLAGLPMIRSVLGEVGDGICPLGFVIMCDERDQLRSKLSDAGVYCPVHWPISNRVADVDACSARELSSRILTIPCDQRYKPQSMRLVADVFVRALRDL